MSVQLQETKIRSASKEVVIGHEHPFAIIGERINPTGRRIFQEINQAPAEDVEPAPAPVPPRLAVTPVPVLSAVQDTPPPAP